MMTTGANIKWTEFFKSLYTHTCISKFFLNLCIYDKIIYLHWSSHLTTKRPSKAHAQEEKDAATVKKC